MHLNHLFTGRSILTNWSRCSQLARRCKQLRPDLSPDPALWYEDYPISLVGRRQSPVNIPPVEKCVLNKQHLRLSSLVLQYPSLFNDLKIRNPRDDTYFGWRVDIPYDFGDKTVLTGGPLAHRYKLIQFHAHWGKDCSCGSEHLINGKNYSAELHFVHWNSELFSSARQAAVSKDGLAVVAVFLEGVQDDSADVAQLDSLDTICQMTQDIKYKGAMKSIGKPLNLLQLIPEDRSYWTYLGSLTTPPLWETVTWIIFENPIRCHQRHIDAFRQISYYRKEEIKDLEKQFNIRVEENYRPVQPLNGRPILYVKDERKRIS